MCVLDPGHRDTVDREETEFPPVRTRAVDLFLDVTTGTMSPTIPTEESSIGYALDGTSPQIDFNHTFAEEIELMGRPVVALWVSVYGHDDADLLVRTGKLVYRGRQVWHPFVGLGQLS